MRPLTYSDQTKRLSSSIGALVRASAVAHNAHNAVFCFLAQLQRDVRRVRVTRHIGQRFLNDPDDGGRAVAAEVGMHAIHSPLNLDTVAVRKVVDQPVYRRNQTEVIQHHGSQVGGDPAHRCDGRIDHALHTTQLRACTGIRSGASSSEDRSIFNAVSCWPRSSCNSRAMRDFSSSRMLSRLA